MSTPKVYRDEIKEGRTGYFVTYQPADCRFPFASADLVFPEVGIDTSRVAHAMEKELETWLKRYAVPVMVAASDAKGDLIRVRTDASESCLMGYHDLKAGRIVRRWGILKENELPMGQSDAEYLQSVYRGVGFREQAAVHDAVNRETRNTAKAAWVVTFFLVIVPVMIEIISLGVAWLGYILSAISITVGIYKAAKAFGWIKPSEREKAKAEEDRKMRHYYWHCELNPEAFYRLKVQNSEREAIERTRKEALALGMKTGSKR